MKRLIGTRFTDGSDKSDVFMTLLLFCLINRCLFRLPLIYSCSRSRLRDRLGRLNGRLIHCAGKSHVQEMREVGRLVFRKAKGSTAYQSTGLLAEIGHRENLAGNKRSEIAFEFVYEEPVKWNQYENFMQQSHIYDETL